MLLRAAGSEMDNERRQDWKRWLLRLGLIVVAMLVIGAVTSQSSSPNRQNSILRSFVANTRPLVSGDILNGDLVDEQDFRAEFNMVVGILFQYLDPQKEEPGRCTGVIISRTKVLTAGHCCDPHYTTEHQVISSERMIASEGWKPSILEISGLETYDYDGKQFAYNPDNSKRETPLYDLCLISLSAPLVAPLVKLVSQEEGPPQEFEPPQPGSEEQKEDPIPIPYTMIGYGLTGEDVDGKNKNFEVHSAAAKPVACPGIGDKLDLGGNGWDKHKFDKERWGLVQPVIFCATGVADGTNACGGDSGGPFLGDPDPTDGNKRKLYGILSDGRKPCKEGMNSYSDLSKPMFANWLAAKVDDLE